jgi:hypothetical protein
MCRGDWEAIDFNKVPSCAMKKLKKAFERNTPESFKEWKKGLNNGESKVNAKQLYPYELIKEVRKNCFVKDEVVIEQWNVLQKELKKKGKLDKTLVVVDTSGSMHCSNYLPIDNAVALGLMVSECVEGDFKNLVMTFSKEPEFCEIRGGDVYDRYNQIKGIKWQMNTDIQAVFREILKKGKENELSQDDMPQRVIIISDMQFDKATKYGSTNLEEINEKYKISGYERPDLIFWNVAGDTNDYPATILDDGTCLVSGFSPGILEAITNNETLDSVKVMLYALNNERYQQIRKFLNE